MMKRLLSSELLKLRRSMALVLMILGPVGVVLLEAMNFGLRYDYLTKEYEGRLWFGLLGQTAGFSGLALLLGAALLASMLAGCEHRTQAWKQLLALPVTRFQVFLSKAVVCAGMLLVSSILLGVGLYVLGLALGFGWIAPWGDLLRICFYPFFGALAVVSLQLWLSVILRNQAIPLAVGILGTTIGMLSFGLPQWVLWKWAIMDSITDPALTPVAAGISVGLLLLLVGAVHFGGRDVH